MARISSIDRNQTFLFCLDNYISDDNPVRIIDSFVNNLNLEQLGFITFKSSAPGQQPYSRSDLLKLHLYGYVSGIRSSRKLATECSRNIELIWLINGILPSKSSISDFVKVNEVPIQNTFKKFVQFLKFADFIDGKINVIDGTKIRAQNSRNKYYSIKKIDNTISYFYSQIQHYTSLLKDETSSDSNVDSASAISFKDKISNYQQKIQEFSTLKKKLTDSNLSQVTLTDPDSRMMTSHGNSDISYNLQSSVDAKNSLIVAFDVVNDINDSNQLQNLHQKASDNLGSSPDAIVADMGYFNTSQIAYCISTGSKVFVKRPKTKNSTNNSDFSIDKFSYIPDKNIYICPNSKQLDFVRAIKKKKDKDDDASSVIGYEYFCSSCSNCPFLLNCTSSVDGRRVTRNAFQDVLDIVQKNFDDNPDMYIIRKCVVEHPFGTIKRSMGYTYFLRKGLMAVNTEAALISLAYDLKRLPNISSVKDIIQKMEDFFLYFYSFFTIFYIFQKNHKFKKEFMIFYYLYFNFMLTFAVLFFHSLVSLSLSTTATVSALILVSSPLFILAEKELN